MVWRDYTLGKKRDLDLCPLINKLDARICVGTQHQRGAIHFCCIAQLEALVKR